MATGRPIARRLVAMSFAVAAGLGLADISASAASHKPRRATPAPLSHDAEPDNTATIPARPATQTTTSGPTAKPDDQVLGPSFHLPNASHARMRDCGLKWRAMRMSGEAGDDIWRDFATRCLASANGPFDKP